MQLLRSTTPIRRAAALFRFVATSIATFALIPLSHQTANAQGCVAVRPMECSLGYMSGGSMTQQGQLEVSTSYQYYRSFRHFRGDEEEEERVENGTEVININHAMDLGFRYGVSDRMSLSLNIPFIYYDRSSLYEHYGNSESANPTQARFETGAQGLGDVRLSGSYWMFDPATSRGNLSLGLGIKAPTGNAEVQGTFHKVASDGSDSTVVKAVDQSIQLGDGGWGFAVMSEGYQSLFSKTALYYDGFYLFNPRVENDVPYSVADQYAARAGLDYSILPRYGLSASLGGRIEGIPSEDLIGESDGRRRPGYIVSIEPGIAYRYGALNFALNVPYALYRNRTQSVSDKERTQQTGVYTNGDAAFADYLVNFTMSFQFGQGHTGMPPMESSDHAMDTNTDSMDADHAMETEEESADAQPSGSK